MRSSCMPNEIELSGGPAATAAAVFLTTIIVGCVGTRGPDLVVSSHIDYNKAVSQVLKEELLLNVVRRRYLEAPQFLNVASINTTFSTTTSVGANGLVGDIGDGNIVDVGVDGRVVFTDSPTITITPRQGEAIATQLHQPLSVSTVTDLVTAGYPIDVVINLLVEGINDLRGPDLLFDGFRPASPEWREALELITNLYRQGSLIVDRFRWNDPYNDHPYPAASITPEMWITTLSTGARRWKTYDVGETFYFTTHEMAPAIWLDPSVHEAPEGQRLMELLNVQPDVQKKIWLLEPARVAKGPDLADRPVARRPTLKLRMRSLYSVLNLYSCAVRVPPSDEAEGRASDHSTFREATTQTEGKGFAMKLAIKSSERPPESAFLGVQYRGLWFYIDDRDLNSKAGFNSLYDLWQLAVKAPGSQTQPVTTIQVN